ncbi:type II secretion system protein GspD [Rubritalea marina]|uniref:type II secretion system protein GspD n=1 Tax=Rubritalea marina TaxID=361055 RepID=UPI00037ABCBA|nr:secretin N-terminal domain-containing protein [Rubritalea marina]
MKLLPTTLAAFAVYAASVQAQDQTPPEAPQPVADFPASGPTPEPEPVTPELPGITEPEEEVADAALPGEEPLAEEQPQQTEMENGMRLNDADLNTVFEVLARGANLSYFHNNRIAGEEFKVNGYLRDGDALTQMEDLAFNNGLTLHRRGNTIYALTGDQLNQLPSTEWTYSLRYLRSANMKQHITSLVRPLCSANAVVNYEEKTNTLIVIDTPYKIERVQSLLSRIDRAKGQIVVEVKIYRVIDSVGQNIGVDWESALGATGGTGLTAGLNSMLGLPIGTGAEAIAGDLGDIEAAGALVFTPDQITGVLRALNDAGITRLQNNPVLITEDNELANISVIDRVPIITSTTTTGTSSTTSEEVRYKIDEEDSNEPENTREIGTTISVTPTLLPDGTIRLKMRPRAASITEFVEGSSEAGSTPNRYPRVLESSLTTIARIPDGHSLVVGGFFSEQETEIKNKVPLLGDIPVINFFFKSSSTQKEKSSLIFVVTPTSYDPTSHASNNRVNDRVNSKLEVPKKPMALDGEENDYIADPGLSRTWKNIKKEVGKPFNGSSNTSSGNSYKQSPSGSRRR